MNIIDEHKLLSPQQIDCLENNSSLTFNIGGFTSINDILSTLDVDVVIEPGVITRDQLPSWKNMKQSFDEIKNHWKNEIDRLDGRRGDDKSIEELRNLQNIIENHRNEMDELANMPLRGLYDPKTNNITLFPNEMKQEYGGTRMEELLVSTLAHETMHAYFNRPDHDSYPYVYFVEEPLAEFGMLLYIHETEKYRNVKNQYLFGKNQSDFYQWAYDDVKSKTTSYRYGTNLMDQCLKEGLLSPICAFLVSYKIQIDEYSALYPIKGEIKLPSQSRTKSTSVSINGQIVNVKWKNIIDLVFKCPTYFYDNKTHTIGLDGDWNAFFQDDTFFKLFMHILEMNHVKYLFKGDSFFLDENRFDMVLRHLNIVDKSDVCRQNVKPKWKNIFSFPTIFPTNFPTYFWDENTHTFGLNGDWRRSVIYCFDEMRIDFLNKYEDWNLYLGDCFTIDNYYNFFDRIDWNIYGHNSVIVDRLNPFCKIDNNGMARYNNGSLLPIYRKCGKDFYKIRKCGKWGIVKDTGEVFVSCKYDYIDSFEDNGLCKVGNSDDNGFHYGFVNEQGIEQIPVIYEDWCCYYPDSFYFENGVAVAKKDGRYGIINENNIIIHPFDMNYSSMTEICNGYATMEDSNGKWGAIDAKGKIVIPCQYDRGFFFNEEGIAEVEKDGKEFKIDTNGNSI